MTADVDLLPLPNLWEYEGSGVISARITPDDMRDYARANVLHHTEALRAEVARLAEVHAGYAAQAFTLTNRAERLAEALRQVEGHASRRGNGDLLQFVRAALHPTAAQEEGRD